LRRKEAGMAKRRQKLKKTKQAVAVSIGAAPLQQH
jgi:hypothetical protein